MGAVVLNWHDPTRTVACVTRLLADPQVGHVWVVDNESDGTLAPLLREPTADGRVTVLEQAANLGFSAGMNAGLRPACAAYDEVLALNNDASVEPADLARLRAALAADPRCALTAPVVVTPAGVVSSRGGRLGRRWDVDETGPATEQPDFVTWACVVVRSAALAEAGFLDERFFMYWEDVEVSLRLRREGWHVRLVPDARCVHEVSVSHVRAGTAVPLYSSYGLVTLSRVVDRPHGRALAWWRVGARAAKALVRRRPGEARAHLRGARLAARAGGRPAYEVLGQAGVVRRGARG